MTDAFQKEFHAAFNAPRDRLTALIEEVMGARVASLELYPARYIRSDGLGPV